MKHKVKIIILSVLGVLLVGSSVCLLYTSDAADERSGV